MTGGGLARWLVAVTPAMAAVVFWRPGYDVFLTVKATVVVLGALALLALGLLAWGRSGRVIVPSRRIAIPLIVYVLALGVATAAAERPWLAVAGRAGRHTGLAVALAAVVLFTASAVAFRDRRPTLVVAAVLLAAVPVSGYGLVQAFGADPFAWDLLEGGPAVFSTLGNANFLSAWLGMIVPLAAWGALQRSWWPPWRVGGGLLAVVALATAAASGSVQGVVAGLAGIGIVIGGWLVVRGWEPRALAVGAGALAVAVGTALAAAPADLAGRAGRSLTIRLAHWETAWRMAADHPWRGVGPAGFGGWFRIYERPEEAAARGLARSLDHPHNIALDLLTAGGWPLLLSWVVLVLAVAWSVLRAWRSADAERRLVLAGLSGAWVAYLLGLAVSIEVAPVAALGWTVAGLLVAASGQLRAEAAPAHAAPGGSATKETRWPIRVLAVGLVLALTGAAAGALRPLRADLAAARGLAAEERSDLETAKTELAHAAEIARWEPRYPSLLGAHLNRDGAREAALHAHEEAHRRDPRAVTPLLNIGRLALALDDAARARAAYAEAVRLAPHTPEVQDEAARHLAP